ncbi:MAG TPA: hypothetical protein VFC00_06565 [Micromonosporaceae bacterium]|nr:hypothetical protein [Micromonosporaceae bacterium]
MSTRCYVGVLDADGRTYHARYVHFDGGPDTMPFLLAAVWWHTFGRDGAATGRALLAHDWETVEPDITDRTARTFAGYRPVPGVGIAFPPEDSQPHPVTGTIAEPTPATPIQWMYLIDLARPDTLLTFTNSGRWTLTGRTAMTVGRDVTVAPD